mgnify:CR=1 FL=1
MSDQSRRDFLKKAGATAASASTFAALSGSASGAGGGDRPNIIFIMTGGGPGYASYTLPLYAYLKAYKSLNFGYASTIAVMLMILLTVIVVAYVVRIMRTEERLK